MREIEGDIWDYHKQGYWIVIPTNGNTNIKNVAIMGKGLALQAVRKFPKLPQELGELIQRYGNKIFMFGEYKLITFPTKNNWWENSDTLLIINCLAELFTVREASGNIISGDIYLPRLGCGNGLLDYEKDVKPLLEEYLDDSFVVVNY